MANETFNPAGASREEFAALFRLPAQLEDTYQSLASVVAALNAESATLTSRLNALDARVRALEEGADDA